MAGVQETGPVHSFLVQGRGHHRLHLPGHGKVTGAHHIFHRGPLRAGAHLPHRHFGQLDVRQIQQRHRSISKAAAADINNALIPGPDVQPRRRPVKDALVADHERPAGSKHLLMLQRLQNHLRPNAGGVAQGNGQYWTAVSHGSRLPDCLNSDLSDQRIALTRYSAHAP